MKKILLFIGLCAFAMIVSAQAPTISTKIKTSKPVQVGYEQTFNVSLKDTLKSGDTLFYIFPISTNGAKKYYVIPSLSQDFKLVSADAAVTATFYESFNGTKWDTIKQKYAKTTYSKTISLTTGYHKYYNGMVDSVIYFDMDYYAVRYIAATNSSFKTIPSGRFQTILK